MPEPTAESSAASRRARRRERERRKRRRRVFAVGGAALVLVAAVGGWQLATDGGDDAARVRTADTTSSTTTTTTTTVPQLQPPYSEAVKEENAKPGSGAWRLTNDGGEHDMEGYLGVTSAQRGDTVTLYASTTAPSFTFEVYRMGWYQGLGGRLVWTSPTVAGVRQAPATRIAVTNTYEAEWKPSTQFTVQPDWPDGAYLLKLISSTGVQRWVPLTVRDDTSTAAYVIVDAVSSWQAYNHWGGCSLYDCHAVGGQGTRSQMVSFDRPYDKVTDGSGDFVGNELPLIMRAEEANFDVTYMTSIDVQQRPDLLKRHKAMLSLGHDEYWSKEMFDGAEGARDAGVNLAFFGANAVYRQVRFEASAIGPDRHMVNYRSIADPIRRTDPARTTVSFRDSPVNRPEAQLIGEQYQCNPVRADGIVIEPQSWIFANTGLGQDAHIEILVGSEYDQYVHGQGGPDNVEIVAHSPVTCHGRPGYSDVTYYTAPSGAGVFATGTNYWVSKLEPPEFPKSAANPVIVTVTRNVLDAFGVGPAGQAHPSQPNWKGLPGTGTP